MSNARNILAASVGTALLTVGAGAGLALAGGAGAEETMRASGNGAMNVGTDAVGDADEAVLSAVGGTVELDEVVGAFAFSQEKVSSNEWMVRNLAEGSRYLCGAHVPAESDSAATQEWQITVDGAVDRGFSATIGEICASHAVQALVMGCSCLGNPADGRSVANALVQGVSAQVLVAMAAPKDGANTVVFTSSDGYQIALPLSYIQTHYCPIVFNVNGSALEQSVGGTNQLWLGSTPASYFVRDVVAVTLEQRAKVPASPASDEARAAYAANLPNVGVLLGGEVA